MPTPVRQSPTGVKKKKAGSVIDRISALGTQDNFLKVLLYGKSGTGKTTLWATFPGPILGIICSGGNKTGEVRSINTPEYRKKIKMVTIQESTEVGELVSYVQSNGAFKTIVLDHVSGLQDLVLKEILGLDELPAQKSWGLATQQQYGQCTQQVKEYLRALLNLDLNVVILGQERTFDSTDEGPGSEMLQPTVGVALTPSLAGWLNPACDYILQTFKRAKMIRTVTKVGTKQVTTEKRGKGVEYCLRTEPHDVYTTKFRVPKGRPLPDVIVDPSFDKINRLIQGE